MRLVNGLEEVYEFLVVFPANVFAKGFLIFGCEGGGAPVRIDTSLNSPHSFDVAVVSLSGFYIDKAHIDHSAHLEFPCGSTD